ncbi:hypothetical protein RLEG3_18635 [Rhizobium leguminosarum bv. trifolii WSM1689]|uniref:Rap1a/Tai family immunity protein n=1 Tax=Rhizobium leguminosarum TaxID=384 RepID=UPI0003E0AC16|nr:Rap1a/Tai family immunity protein [Rhizobium leguminosarum]AHF83712.1 hypothetical protein RLEG3_18635 [Rhizobium leguminosarum bv. trifolii WSM1689]
MTRLMCATILLALGASPAAAYFLTGNDLYQGCDTNNLIADKARTMNYVLAVYDYDDFLRSALLTSDKMKAICLGENATAGQLTDVVCKYLRENPETRDRNAGFLVRLALAKTWSCH